DRGERMLEEMLAIDRASASELLERAGGHVKTALVMGRLGLDPEAALRHLEEVGGVVARVVGETKP
ncbi:MAG: N-acetylmuramic acid 6-phosphate etherase, partial [Gemmatimonadota bacterium]|nr:N-acetylmuramic acid 6-phosphate etherase [Gemmatimonadota bacterium]